MLICVGFREHDWRLFHYPLNVFYRAGKYLWQKFGQLYNKEQNNTQFYSKSGYYTK